MRGFSPLLSVWLFEPLDALAKSLGLVVLTRLEWDHAGVEIDLRPGQAEHFVLTPAVTAVNRRPSRLDSRGRVRRQGAGAARPEVDVSS